MFPLPTASAAICCCCCNPLSCCVVALSRRGLTTDGLYLLGGAGGLWPILSFLFRSKSHELKVGLHLHRRTKIWAAAGTLGPFFYGPHQLGVRHYSKEGKLLIFQVLSEVGGRSRRLGENSRAAQSPAHDGDKDRLSWRLLRGLRVVWLVRRYVQPGVCKTYGGRSEQSEM